jgi:L-ascorbate metabolism protein UlaG (beta-lactamase superfamily)
MRKHFGARPTKKELQRYAQSKNWNGKEFLNLEETTMDIGLSQMPTLLYKQFFVKKGRTPKSELPIAPFNQEDFLSPSSKTKYIWYGHSALLLRMSNQTILIDPMLGPNAAPISPFPIKRFSKNTLGVINDFPEIDLLLLSHDHYDHLDYDSIQLLKHKVKKYYVALGVKRHLVKWGVSPELITEFDWWDLESHEEIDITFTPSRHFSGRGIGDRAKSLWGGWVFKTPEESIWFTGDGGYGGHFKEVGDRLGPFDLAFVECGQYNKLWRQIHMFPEEAVQAAIDGQVKVSVPVHWGGFALAQHSWTDPANRFVKAAAGQDVAINLPRIGQLFSIESQQQEYWWKNV